MKMEPRTKLSGSYRFLQYKNSNLKSSAFLISPSSCRQHSSYTTFVDFRATLDVKLTENDVPGAKLRKSPRDSNVTDLKRWLECHGLKKTGKREELVHWVEQAMAIAVPVNVGVDGGKWYQSKMNEKVNEGEKKWVNRRGHRCA